LPLLKQIESEPELIFRKPVLEEFPDLEIAYLRIVETPMDLRTIDEIRIFEYKSIQEMQQDLILMFQNCCKFNETGSEIWNYTK
jgi:hypothetical protein